MARLKYEAEDMDQPSILDYIKVKQEGVDLEKAIVDIKRKTEILQMEYQQKRAMLGQLNASYGLTPMSPGPGGANMFSARTTAMTPRGTVDGLGKGGPLTPTRQ